MNRCRRNLRDQRNWESQDFVLLRDAAVLGGAPASGGEAMDDRAAPVLARGDATDRNIPLMIWYAAEPLVEADPKRAREPAATSKLPKLREFIVRRMLESGSNQQND